MRVPMLAALLAAVLVTQSALAQVAVEAHPLPKNLKPIPSINPEFQDPTNAALVYNRAFLLMTDELSKKIGDSINSADPNWTPDAEVCKLLTDNDNLVNTLLRASRLDTCDFGVEYSEGIGALLPHLGKMRAGARLLAADARRLARENKPDDAAERIVAIFAMARHCNHDRLLISALVSIAIHSLACSQVEYLMNSAQVTEAGKQAMLAAMDRFAGPDPFAVKAAVRGEHYWAAIWSREQLKQPNGMEVFRSQLVTPMEGDRGPDAAALKAMDQKAAIVDLEKIDVFYTAVGEVFDLPDARERLAALTDRVMSGEFGVIAKQIVPAMGKCYESHTKALARQNDVRTRLANFVARPN